MDNISLPASAVSALAGRNTSTTPLQAVYNILRNNKSWMASVYTSRGRAVPNNLGRGIAAFASRPAAAVRPAPIKIADVIPDISNALQQPGMPRPDIRTHREILEKRYSVEGLPTLEIKGRIDAAEYDSRARRARLLDIKSLRNRLEFAAYEIDQLALYCDMASLPGLLIGIQNPIKIQPELQVYEAAGRVALMLRSPRFQKSIKTIVRLLSNPSSNEALALVEQRVDWHND